MPSLSCVAETLSFERLRARFEPPSDDERLLAELHRPAGFDLVRKWLGGDYEVPPRSPDELSSRLGWGYHETSRLLWRLADRGKVKLVIGRGFRPVRPLQEPAISNAEKARRAKFLEEADSLHSALSERFGGVPPHRVLQVGSLALARVAADDPEYMQEAGKKVPGNPMERAIEAILVVAADTFDAPLWLTAVERSGRPER